MHDNLRVCSIIGTFLFKCMIRNHFVVYLLLILLFSQIVVISSQGRMTRKKRILASLQDDDTNGLRQRDKRVRIDEQNPQMIENPGFNASYAMFIYNNIYNKCDYKQLLNV